MIYPWRRRAVPLGRPVRDRGWQTSFLGDEREHGQVLEEMRDVPVLVLFGERGTGKSVALRQECKALQTVGMDTSWVDLGRCELEGIATATLTDAFTAPAAGEWWVILDSLDEGLNVLPGLASLIAQRIERLTAEQRDRLRLRVSCRTGRWPRTLQESLLLHWPAESCVQHVVLTPLSVQDIGAAAEAAGADTASFTRALRERGLSELAKAPVTLLQLIEHQRVHGALPATVADAYHQACLRLCTETRRSSDIRDLRSQPTGEHLLAVAARVAAVMQFAAHTTLCDDPQCPAPGGEVHLDQLEGGEEPGPLGNPFSCTTDELRRLTESHLFEPIGLHRWTFTHRSYQEFLAAHYLTTHHVEPPAQTGLLWIGDGPARHIYPAHREVAAWRSGSDEALFEDLLRHDPQVLLLADLPARPTPDRVRVIEAVFSVLEHDDTIDIDHTTLHRLDHPGLPQQLRPRLAPDTDGLALYTALGIARRCLHPELAENLLRVAQTTELPEELRAIALRALILPAHDEDAVVSGVRGLAATDSSPEVVAAALQQLWPAQLTLNDFLDCFRDPAPDYLGRAWILRSEIPAQLTPAQTAQGLLWARDALQQPADRSIVLAVSLIAHGITLAGTEGLPGLPTPEAVIGQALLAAGAHTDILYGLEGHSAREDLSNALRDHHALRRAITLYLLTHATQHQFFSAVSAGGLGCLPTYEDGLYWMNHWEQIADLSPDMSRRIVAISPPADAAQRARAEAARAAFPALRQATSSWDWDETPPADQQDVDETQEQNHPAYSETSLRDALTAVHAAGPDAVRPAWGNVLDHMRRTRDASPVAGLHTEPLLTLAHQAVSRPALGSDLDTALRAAALHVLATVPSLPPQLLAHGPHARWGRMLELSAFAVLGETTADVNASETHWAGWTIALATTQPFTSPATAVRDVFLPYCADRAGRALTQLLPLVLKDAEPDTTHLITRAVAAHASAETVHALIAWADHPNRTTAQWLSVISALAFHDDPEAITLLRTVLTADTSALDSTPVGRARWILAARTLLYCPALPRLWPTVRDHLSDDTIRHAYLDSLRQPPANHGQSHHLADLSEEALADLYILLADHLGVEALDPPWRSGWTGEDHIGGLTRSIPQLLQSKNTPQAAHQLRCLADHTGLRSLRHLARTAASAAADARYIPTTPGQLTLLAIDSKQRRSVTDEGHLLSLVLEALNRFQDTLHRPNGLLPALWNRSDGDLAKAEWWPCWEEDLSDIIATFLLQAIGGHRVVVNREVQVQRSGLAGRRTDIQIEALAPPGSGHDPVKVVIECKGCWNNTLPTALGTQLVDGYLQTPRTAGVLLTGYFDCDRWTTRTRRCPKSAHALDDIHQHQLEQARVQRLEKGVSVEAFTLDCALPAHAA
ncbi:hypothetical protein ACWD3Z_00475 [Streptomyces sp. NPDC002740]